MHFFAANGYVVLYTNPRGSQGYGKKFADAITGKWAEPAYSDLMKCVKIFTKKNILMKIIYSLRVEVMVDIWPTG